MLESDHQGVLAYAAPLEDLDRFRCFWENRKPAHLFMICSNLKLTSAKESIGIERRFFMNNSNEIEGTLELLPD